MTSAADRLRRVANDYDLRKTSAEERAEAGDRVARELAFTWATVAIVLYEVAEALELEEREAA